VGENIFFNLAAECLFNFGLSIHKIFRDVSKVYFISNVIDERARIYHLQWIGMF